MRHSHSLALAVALVASHAHAGEDFVPIPPSVWAIKEGPKGAVVLERRMRFNVTSIDYVYRVRVFAEAGREAAEIGDIPTNAIRVKGRTVYPDGRQVVFNSRKDFAERKIESGSGEHRQTHLVAPGVNADCVVEFYWSESANGEFGGLPSRLYNGFYGNWRLVDAFPTETLAVEVGRPFPLAWSLNPGSGGTPESSDASSYRKLTLRNVPAFDPPPYTLASVLRPTTMVMFYQPEDLRGPARVGANRYWEDVCKSYFRNWYEESIDRGGAYKQLSQELTYGLPKEPVKAAAELLARLDARIANMSHATFAEAAALPKDFWEGFRSTDLAKAAKTGKTNSRGMQLLYFHLLKDAGLTPKLAKVPDRDQTLFDWNAMNLFQFDQDLIGIDDPQGGTAWFDPTLRFATPGVVHQDYTAVPALIIDTHKWTPSRGPIGGLQAAFNSRRYTYALDLSDESDAFTAQAEFGGYPEYLERTRYMALEPKEQAKALKERFEKALKNLTVESSEVWNATDAKASVAWRVKGALERESSRMRVVDPFPGMPWPLWVPSKIEEKRTAPIVLPYLSTQVATSSFAVPKGFVMGPHEDLRRENVFGRVLWIPSYDAATKQVKVVLRVEVNTLSTGPDRWNEFKTFLAWIEDACRRQVTLSKEG